jgi:transposase
MPIVTPVEERLRDVPPEDWAATPQSVRERFATLVMELQKSMGLQEVIEALSARVKHLEDRLAKDSHNSSRPPTTDSRRRSKKDRSLRKRSGRKTGAQPGHAGQTLHMVEHPEKIIELVPQQCEHCGQSLEAEAVTETERRQVLDLPPIRLEAMEYQAHKKRCPHCHRTTKAAFPEGVTQVVQYGSKIKSTAVYLHIYQLLPYERTVELMSDLFGAAPAEGTLALTSRQCADALVETEEQIKKALQESAVMGLDETGMYVAGKREWLHAAVTPELTHYGRHAKRGKEGTDAIGIAPGFHGQGIHDGWAPYLKYAWQHRFCNAHHCRELTFLHEEHHQPWAKKLKEFLFAVKDAVEEAKGAQQDHLSETLRRRFRKRYGQILAEGLRLNPMIEARHEGKKRGRLKQSPSRNMLVNLSQRAEGVLGFMNDFRVPFDNNQVERDLRMMKLQQKISGCFRSGDHADWFCRIRSYLSTMKKQGRNVLESIQAALLGAPFSPVRASDA